MKKTGKKTWMSLLAALSAVGLLAGCGDAQEGDRPGSRTELGLTKVVLNEMQTENYVTLGDYKNMTVSVQEVPAVSEEERQELLLAVYRSYVTAEAGGITDRPVKTGDTVIIDYVGKKDGVPFDRGSETDAELTIGSGGFIPGFEDGLVGVTPGTTVDLNLSFPEDYKNSAEMAGQAVVFTVTVKFILPEFGEMKDEAVAAWQLPDVSDLEGLKRYVDQYLADSAEEQRVYNLQNAIMKQLTESCTVAELPETFVEEYKAVYRNNLQQAAAANNTTADIYANYFYGMGSEDVAALYGQVQARQEILLQAIANQEGLKVSEEDMDTLMSDYAAQAGFASVEEMLTQVPKEQLRNYFMSNRVMEYLRGIVKVETTPAAGAQ